MTKLLMGSALAALLAFGLTSQPSEAASKITQIIQGPGWFWVIWPEDSQQCWYDNNDPDYDNLLSRMTVAAENQRLVAIANNGWIGPGWHCQVLYTFYGI